MSRSNTYIDGKQMLGIKYDWKRILKRLKSLKIPKEFDISSLLPLDNDNIGWFILNSERSVGKTTICLLIGMCMYEEYGTITQIIRHKIAKASYYKELFKTVNSMGYVQKVTGGKYDVVEEHWRRFYYGKRLENGKIERCKEPFAIALDASECYSLCSVYECPLGDWIILDECFNRTNTAEEYVNFCHLFKTIARERLSPRIMVLGNNLDVNNIWYRQLCIHNIVRTMHKGDIRYIENANGRNLFVAFLENKMPETRAKFNKKFFGNGSSEINAITGYGDWNTKEYPQTCALEDREILQRGVYFSYHDDLYFEMSIITSGNMLYCEFHPATYKGAINGDICYTLRQPHLPNERYFGYDKLSRFILKMIDCKKVVFNDNETGDLFEKFLTEVE